MAVPVIASTATQNANGFTDPTIVFSKPSGVAAGDLLLVGVCNRDGSACSPPSGWTTIDLTVYTGGSPNLLSGAYYRVADGSEGSTFSFGFTSTTDRSVGVIHRITGADGTTPLNAHGQSGQVGDSAADTSPSVTTTVNDCLILTTHDHDGDPITNTVPAGTTALYYGNNNGVATNKGASTSLASAGATGTYQWDISGFAVEAVLRTLAVAPATGGGGGGTTFTSSLTGTLTASATLARRAGKSLSGTLAASGSLARRAGKALAGSLASSGSLARRAGKALVGSISASGSLARSTGKALSGTLSAAGSLARRAGKALSGSLTASGSAVAAIRTRLVALSGTLTASGSAVARVTGKALSGSLAASGGFTRSIGKALAGSASASATFAAARAVLIALSGTLTASGTLARSTGKALAGTLTASGSIRKAIAKGLAGLMTASGAFLKAIGGVVLDTSRHPDPSRSSGTRRGPDPSRSVARRGQD